MKMFTILFFPFLRWLPGGLGLLLRQKLYPYMLGACGRKVLFGRFVNIENPRQIHLGNNVIINDNVTLSASSFTEQGPAITLGDKVFISSGSRLHATDGKIILQSGSSVGSFCIFNTKGTITVGEHVLFAAFCKIGFYPAKYKTLFQDKRVTGQPENDIIIESGCWLGVRSIILPGVSVGTGSIVGAHTVVQKSLHSNVVAVGTPAEVMRNRFELMPDDFR